MAEWAIKWDPPAGVASGIYALQKLSAVLHSSGQDILAIVPTEWLRLAAASEDSEKYKFALELIDKIEQVIAVACTCPFACNPPGPNPPPALYGLGDAQGSFASPKPANSGECAEPSAATRKSPYVMRMAPAANSDGNVLFKANALDAVDIHGGWYELHATLAYVLDAVKNDQNIVRGTMTAKEAFYSQWNHLASVPTVESYGALPAFSPHQLQRLAAMAVTVTVSPRAAYRSPETKWYTVTEIDRLLPGVSSPWFSFIPPPAVSCGIVASSWLPATMPRKTDSR